MQRSLPQSFKSSSIFQKSKSKCLLRFQANFQLGTSISYIIPGMIAQDKYSHSKCSSIESNQAAGRLKPNLENIRSCNSVCTI